MSRRTKERSPSERAHRRDWIIIFILLGVVALALLIVGTATVIDSMDGTLHTERSKPAAISKGSHPPPREELAWRRSVLIEVRVRSSLRLWPTCPFWSPR